MAVWDIVLKRGLGSVEGTEGCRGDRRPCTVCALKIAPPRKKHQSLKAAAKTFLAVLMFWTSRARIFPRSSLLGAGQVGFWESGGGDGSTG
jgi:hypothetical protein